MVLINYTCERNPRNVNHVGIMSSPEFEEEVYLDVSVTNPITRKDSDGEYVTTYAIFIETNDTAFTMNKSMVRRRFNEFVHLRKILQEQHPTVVVPKLPGKTILGKRFDQRFINERCRGLELFLKNILERPIYLSNKSLHLFAQTSLTLKQIKNVVDGIESYELPHNNTTPLVLVCPIVETNKRLGILKTESRSSLVSCPECPVKGKHPHMRVGSGIVICPFVFNKENTAVAGSAPFNIPSSGSPQNGHIRSCASDTCLDGGAGGSLGGSKKRVSFFIEQKQKGGILFERSGTSPCTALARAVQEVAESQEVSGVVE